MIAPMLLSLLLVACRAELDTATKVDDTAPVLDSADPCTEAAWYADGDADGFGATTTVLSCEAPAGFTATPGDCNDADASVFPGAPIDCTDTDADCDGLADNGDADGDRFLACEECDDADADSFPGATERCDEADNDCDGSVDEGAVDASTWYADGDGDGQGGPLSMTACTAPEGWFSTSTDCDDAAAAVYSGADERCNGVDDDCDGEIDEDAVDAPTWHIDYDGDGYGSSAYTEVGCEAEAGWVADDGDCDDTDAAVNPAGTELCNGLDDNCDGIADDGAAAVLCPAPAGVAVTSCGGGAGCAISSCSPNRGNCDGVYANGCEIDTSSNNTHCGGCGSACATGSCASGSCGLVITVEGHANVSVPCVLGDYSCQAHYVCNAVTGLLCVHQSYDCYTGSAGSWYPPDGASGGSNFNFAYAYDFGGGGTSGGYGNICACTRSQMTRYGLADVHTYCGVGHWVRR